VLGVACNLPHRSLQPAVRRQLPFQQLSIDQDGSQAIGQLMNDVITATAERAVRRGRVLALAFLDLIYDGCNVIGLPACQWLYCDCLLIPWFHDILQKSTAAAKAGIPSKLLLQVDFHSDSGSKLELNIYLHQAQHSAYQALSAVSLCGKGRSANVPNWERVGGGRFALHGKG
jgi:hypothetical protein